MEILDVVPDGNGGVDLITRPVTTPASAAQPTPPNNVNASWLHQLVQVRKGFGDHHTHSTDASSHLRTNDPFIPRQNVLSSVEAGSAAPPNEVILSKPKL